MINILFYINNWSGLFLILLFFLISTSKLHIFIPSWTNSLFLMTCCLSCHPFHCSQHQYYQGLFDTTPVHACFPVVDCNKLISCFKTKLPY